jgi:hypothetical protein
VIGSQKQDQAALKDNPNAPSQDQILKAYETVYLFQWLFPKSMVAQKPKEPKFKPLL